MSRGDTTLGAGARDDGPRGHCAPAVLLPNPRPSLTETQALGAGLGTTHCNLGQASWAGSGVQVGGMDPGGQKGTDRCGGGEVKTTSNGVTVAWPWATGTCIWTRACVQATRPQSESGCRQRAAGRMWLVPGRPAFQAPLAGPHLRSVPRNPYLLLFWFLPSFRKLKTILG